jgi:hypothetical protein
MLKSFVGACFGFLIIMSIGFVQAGQFNPIVIAGKITDGHKSPVIGASIKIQNNNKTIAWAISDSLGRYGFFQDEIIGDSIQLSISAIGHFPKTLPVKIGQGQTSLNIILDENPVEMGTIVVKSNRPAPSSGQPYTSENITQEARRSIIPTNPMGVIKQAQVVREGSGQSAKIRVSGTSPRYYINGAEMGYDPNHYGMFSIIASPVLNDINFRSQGTPAGFESPAAVEFRTPISFDKHLKAETDFSFVEATGTISMGDSRYFVLISLRKSVLDQLADRISFHSNRLAIPPTAFTDVFISGGLNLSSHYRLITDQYYVKDHLSYEVGSSRRNPSGIQTAQSTQERFFSMRLEAAYPRLSFKIEAATKSDVELYRATPGTDNGGSNLNIDLSAQSRTNLANAEAIYRWGKTALTIGNSFKYISNRQVNLKQSNWNFLPPDATSDIPFIYQLELNYLWGSYQATDNESDNAGYLSWKSRLGRFEFEMGLRDQYFGRLNQSKCLNYRGSIGLDMGKAGRLGAFYGTFSESPAKRILEAYQVLVLANLTNLSPVNTRLLAANYTCRFLTLGAFTKDISNLPILTPDFMEVDIENKILGSGFLMAKSSGILRSYGADISTDFRDILIKGFDFNASYGYTNAYKLIDGTTIPYELNAPHKIFIQSNYRLNHHLNIGGNLDARSGFPYTPSTLEKLNYSLTRYTYAFYRDALAHQNQRRFPSNIVLSIYADFSWGNSQLYLTIANVTNRKNPIISTADGFVYDAGILPSLGFSYKF